jgi:hypothetical protein
VVADNNRFGRGVELGEAVEDLAHRHEPGPFYPGEGELPRFPDIEQDRPLTPFELSLELARRDALVDGPLHG